MATKRRSRQPAPSAARRRAAPPRRGARSPGPRKLLPARLSPRAVAFGSVWLFVLLLRLFGFLRAGGSVVFWLAAASASVYAVGALRESADVDPWRTARRAVLLAVLVVTPVAFDPTTHDVFNVTKYTVVLVGALVVCGLWAVEWARQGRAPLWRNGLHWPVLALAAWSAVAAVTSITRMRSLLGGYQSNDGLLAALAFVVLFFGITEAFRGADVQPVLSAFYFAAGGLIVLYGLIQLHDRVTSGGGRWDWVPWGTASFKGSSIWSTFGNPNHLAGFLVILLPVGLVLLLLHRSWVARGLIVVILGGVVLEILQTTTRGAWLAAAIVLPLLAALLLPDLARRPLVAGGAALALVIMVAGGAVFLSSSKDLRSKFSEVFTFGRNSTAAQRVELWKSAVKMAEDRPLVGFGPDNFQTVFPRYQTARFVQLYGPDEQGNGPHNTFMNYLATTGFPGLCAFVAVLGLAARRSAVAWRRLRQRERDGPDAEREGARRQRLVLTAALVAVVAYLGQASFNVQQIGLSSSFWMLLGLLVVASFTTGERADVPTVRRAGGGRRAPRSSGVVGVVGAIAGVVVLAALVVGSGPYRADHAFRNVGTGEAQLRDPQGGEVSLDRVLATVGRDVDRAIAADPWEPVYYQSRGALLLTLATNRGLKGTAQSVDLATQARQAYEHAVRLAPRDPTVLEGYADLLGKIRTVGSADASILAAQEGALRRALRGNPWRPQIATKLADVLIQEGRADDALGVISGSLARRPSNIDLLRAAARLNQHMGRTQEARTFWSRILDITDDAEARTALGLAPVTPAATATGTVGSG